MKKSILILLVGLVGLLFCTHNIGAAEEEGPNISIKISPGILRAGEPIVYEASLSGGDETRYQVGWWTIDPFAFISSLSSTNEVPTLPKLVYGTTVTNTFLEGGLKEVFAVIQDAGTTNGIEKSIVMRVVAFIVQESRDTMVRLQYPNDGSEMWTPGKTYEIKWDKAGSARRVSIVLEQKGNTNTPTLITYATDNDGSFDFTVPFGTNWISKGTENLGGKNFRVRVVPIDLGALLGGGLLDGSKMFPDTSDVSDDWFTIAKGTKLNPVPLSLKNLRFSMADIDVEGTEVGTGYRIESSTDLEQWHTNKVFVALAESSTNSFWISGSPAQSFRVVEDLPK